MCICEEYYINVLIIRWAVYIVFTLHYAHTA